MRGRLRYGLTLFLSLSMVLGTTLPASAADRVVVGSKRFTESYILGELVTQTLQKASVAAEHRQGLGNTGILEQALASGAVDVYPEYTGTIVRELLKREPSTPPTLAELNEWLAPRGLKAAVPLGFNNTYALAMREVDAARLGVDSISGLAQLPPAQAAQLKLGLSHEFLVRSDGWPALKRAYGLPYTPATGLDHGLAYRALAQGQVDVIDVYSTDAQVGRQQLRVLRDDRAFFPRYDAVLLVRATLDERPLATLAGRINEATMVGLNAQVEVDGKPFADVARGFLAAPSGTGPAVVAGAASAVSPAAVTPQGAAGSGLMALLFAPYLGRLLDPPGPWGPKSIHTVIARHAQRVPFERAWPSPNQQGR